ncbi:hypothetical protein GLOTRDRAFT_135799 [Gloeophyllum trabeum ATCC 11539]|uniref:F-box domain-containing protein n=1 Tax=Gloeophyllum trabeum (strain ATCC 11539 / FP-39264 / Madison 617) TaxID=670483 RepID=S7QNZ2_GLOTA|nr:uncharacterized protein GLOTRDRAFT_135799 [Gloeophyllum trabeum ATCC 11539]EPQ61296.1 hypothetical protein GLOTRDRAFT_135799 [Gloeophyllum trabeum ATCC 11539]
MASLEVAADVLQVSGKSAIERQPPEILRIIFDFCFGPYDLLEPSMTQGPNSPWSRTLRDQKSIVRVCKAWWSVGVESLYKHVALRRVGQIPALLRTLDGDSQAQLSHLISSIAVVCAVPDICQLAFSSSLDCLLDKCPRLSKLTYAPIFDGYPGSQPSHDMAPHFRSVTHLAFGDDVPMCQSLFDLLKATTQLKSLSLVVGDLVTHEWRIPQDMVHLVHLEHLSLRVLREGSQDIQQVRDGLNLPNLRSLECSYVHRRLWKDVLPLIASKGATLRMLSLKCVIPYCDQSYAPYDIQPLIEQCPLLEHLIFMADLTFPLCHPTLRWVDILAWSPNTTSWPSRGHWRGWSVDDDNFAAEPPTSWRRLLEGFTREAFPVLERVRLIDPELAAMPYLAVALPPPTSEYQCLKIHVPGATILETFDMIRREDNWPDEDGGRGVESMVDATTQLTLEESDGDDSYITMSTSSSTDSSFDSDDGIFESEATGSAGRLDVAELLEIFEQTQEKGLHVEDISGPSSDSVDSLTA